VLNLAPPPGPKIWKCSREPHRTLRSGSAARRTAQSGPSRLAVKLTCTSGLQCLDCQLEYYDAERCAALIQLRTRKEVRATLAGGGTPLPALARAE